MADNKRYGLVNQLDMEQILLEAQSRWLRPAEICEILRNYKKFRIAPEPANMPPNGSLFLFDRKVLRYFRKDGHNWRKKRDGKTVKEAHERLKAGSIDVLHCYYAHGQENENFQRRSYWMLEEELSHIVLVHYREVKGTRTNFNRLKDSGGAIPFAQETEEVVSNSEIDDSSVSSSFQTNNYQLPSQTTDTTSPSSAQVSEYEDTESAYNHQASSTFHTFLEQQHPAMAKINHGFSAPYYPVSFTNDHQGKLAAIPGMEYASSTQENRCEDGNAGLSYGNHKQLDFASWEDALKNSSAGIQSVAFHPSLSSSEADNIIPKQENQILEQLLRDSFGRNQDFEYHLQSQDEWQTFEGYSSHVSKWPMDPKVQSDSSYDVTKGIHGQEFNHLKSIDSVEPPHTYPIEKNNYPLQNELQLHLSHTEPRSILDSDFERTLTMDGKSNYSSILKHSLMDGYVADEGLKKLDSFNKWMSKELGDVSESVQPSSSGYWDAVENENAANNSGVPSQLHFDTSMMSPSISQDQLFSVIDFSPNWVYAGSENKVLITGRFLTSQQNAEAYKWSCMFGEVEVPAEVVADGVLRCHAPIHKAGRVPFYVSCSNRLACSEVREFEYRPNHIQDENTADGSDGNTNDILLHMRFVKLLSLESECVPGSMGEKSPLSNKISQLMKDDVDEWDRMLNFTLEKDYSLEKMKEQLLQQLLKEKLHLWLLQKEAEGGKGPNVLDQDGQGVLHYAAALGYDWAILPTIAAGVNVNFRDVNGWTALHWAAFSGRERTVASLVSLGAAPGALTDPTLKHPSGRTPADLASSSKHKGIAGYLAENSLSAHLCSLDLKDPPGSDALDVSGLKAVQAVTERNPTPFNDGDLPSGLSMKHSLAAVYNATQAAARIHQVFRVQSFQKKQLKVYGDDKFGMSDERALSLIAIKSQKPGNPYEPVHAAAIRIQNKFRGWKGRKEFLIIRQRIVKIQAHVRGHQVRKSYRKIIWSVGILDKVILRWRRKGSGLRGIFKTEPLIEGSSSQDISVKEDDDDFLKEGRRQTEQRLQKALARVKSMVQYPEARDQYRRLLNVVTEIQETKVVYDNIMNSSEEVGDIDNDLIDLEALLADDTFMLE